MNELYLTVADGSSYPTLIKIDGKDAKLKKLRNGRIETTYSTASDRVKLSVSTYMEIRGKLWWLTSLFYFIVSIFGIFDVRSNFKCKAVRYEAEIFLSGRTECRMRLLRHRLGEKAVAIECTQPVEEKENLCFIDQKAKRRKKIMLFIKIAVVVLMVALLGKTVFEKLGEAIADNT